MAQNSKSQLSGVEMEGFFLTLDDLAAFIRSGNFLAPLTSTLEVPYGKGT